MATGDSTHPGDGAAARSVTTAELFDDDTGRWQITTQTSIYILDLDQRTLLRIPGAAGEHGLSAETGAAYPTTVLEDDRAPQPISQVLQCRVEEPMYVYTNADSTGITLRGTTPLREIRRLTPRARRPRTERS